jgi:hypothetical protein
LTLLQYTFGNPSSEIIFVYAITPIAPEEMPPLEIFFNEKRTAIVKRETHKKIWSDNQKKKNDI